MNSNQTHTADFLKRQAKTLKKSAGVSHTVALEMVAQKHNFASWRHFRNTQNGNPPSPPGAAAMSTSGPGGGPGPVSFKQWLARHRKRDSQLGDIARDLSRDEAEGKAWPDSQTIDAYLQHFEVSDYPLKAVGALENVWKSYQRFLKRERQPIKRTANKNPKPAKRRITFVKNVKQLHYAKRVAEKFSVGADAWVSFDGRKALPVTITGMDERHYDVQMLRASRGLGLGGRAGSVYSLFLDEVRSTPETACINCVTT